MLSEILNGENNKHLSEIYYILGVSFSEKGRYMQAIYNFEKYLMR